MTIMTSKKVTIQIVAQSGHAWEEEFDSVQDAQERAEKVQNEHGDVERVELLTDNGPEILWHM